MASLSTQVGNAGQLRQPAAQREPAPGRDVERRDLAPPGAIGPPQPTPHTDGRPRRRPRTRPSTRSASGATDRLGVVGRAGRDAVAVLDAPSRSTRPAAILVPPMSTARQSASTRGGGLSGRGGTGCGTRPGRCAPRPRSRCWPPDGAVLLERAGEVVPAGLAHPAQVALEHDGRGEHQGHAEEPDQRPTAGRRPPGWRRRPRSRGPPTCSSGRRGGRRSPSGPARRTGGPGGRGTPPAPPGSAARDQRAAPASPLTTALPCSHGEGTSSSHPSPTVRPDTHVRAPGPRRQRDPEPICLKVQSTTDFRPS